MDGWCLSILYNDLMEIYVSMLDNRKLVLPEVKQYCNYIEWLNKQNNNRGLRYWEEYLASYNQQASIINFTNNKNTDTKYELAEEILTFDKGLTDSIIQMAQQQNVTRIHIETCDATYTTEALNFTAYDEQNLSRI